MSTEIFDCLVTLVHIEILDFLHVALMALLNLQVIQAYTCRVPLSVRGFYKPPPMQHPYYSYSVGCSIVEIDILTESSKVSLYNYSARYGLYFLYL